MRNDEAGHWQPGLLVDRWLWQSEPGFSPARLVSVVDLSSGWCRAIAVRLWNGA